MHLSYVSIVSPDYAQLADFYAAHLGLEEHQAWRHEGFRALAVGEQLVLGFHSPEAAAELGVTTEALGTMLTFDPGSVAELERRCAALTEAGIRVIRPLFDTPYGSRQAVFADPDGNLFRLNTFTQTGASA